MVLSLIGIFVFGLALAYALKSKGQLKSKIAHKAIKTHIPRAISVLVLTAQFSELIKVVEHVSIVNVSAALLLLAIIAATKSGTEGGLH